MHRLSHAESPGDVAEHVDAPEPLHRGIGNAIGLLAFAQIGRDEKTAIVVVSHAPREDILVDVREHQIGAFAGERLRDGAPEIARRARHDHRAITEVHVSLLLRRTVVNVYTKRFERDAPRCEPGRRGLSRKEILLLARDMLPSLQRTGRSSPSMRGSASCPRLNCTTTMRTAIRHPASRALPKSRSRTGSDVNSRSDTSERLRQPQRRGGRATATDSIRACGRALRSRKRRSITSARNRRAPAFPPSRPAHSAPARRERSARRPRPSRPGRPWPPGRAGSRARAGPRRTPGCWRA